jgi:hypothetical protein
MKYLLLSSLLIGVGFVSFNLSQPKHATITFGGEKWDFPSTVEEAVSAHGLLYKPPGYYFRANPTGMKVIVMYHDLPGDFNNESQPKEKLFNRDLHSYIFRFDEKAGLFDSLKLDLEDTYKKKFVLTTSFRDKSLFTKRTIPSEHLFLTVNDNLTIGIEQSPPDRIHDRFVAVRLMYNLSLAEMGRQMGNYL